MNRNIPTFLGSDCDYSDARIILFGAPFDGTASFRPGTRFAMSAMRGDSWGLETYSPYQDKELAEAKVFDAGDLELPFGNTAKVLDEIQEFTGGILSGGKIPCMVGGEHLTSLGAFRAVYEKYPDVRVIHFDAHTDLREDYLGEELSHATVMRRIWDIAGDGRIWQFGIRSGERAEFEWAKKHTILHPFDLDGFEDAINMLSGKPVYFSLDLDILDTSVFPGTGTPEPGGVSFRELLDAVLKLSTLSIVGLDVCELSPPLDASGASTAVACKILRELLMVV
jgi:agmatinase